jgi:hypothetical protein
MRFRLEPHLLDVRSLLNSVFRSNCKEPETRVWMGCCSSLVIALHNLSHSYSRGGCPSYRPAGVRREIDRA